MAEIEMTRVRIDTEAEAYPVLYIAEIGNPQDGQGWAIPVSMFRLLVQAQAHLDEAEVMIMRYVAAHNPQARTVHDWLADNGAEDERAED